MIKQAMLFIISLFLFSILACDSASNDDAGKAKLASDNNDVVKLQTIVNNDSLLIAWRKDSLGCLKLRSYESIQVLVEKYDLTKKYPQEIINLIGKPNKEFIEGKKKILTYYYNTCCKDGILDKECDYSWIDFSFTDSTINISKMSSATM
jgi:hypothetical protein